MNIPMSYDMVRDDSNGSLHARPGNQNLADVNMHILL